MLNGGRIWLIIGGVIGVFIIVLGYFGLGSPLFTQAALADTERAGIEAVNATHEQTLAEMMALDAKKDELLERIGELSSSVPVVADLEAYYDELAITANASAVSLVSVTADDPALFVPAAEPGPSNFGPSLQKNLYLIPITINIGGDATQVGMFVNSLQTSGRLQLITKLDTRLGATLTSSITGYIFVVYDPTIGGLIAAPSVTEPEAPTEGEEPVEGEEGVATEEPTPDATPTPPAED